MKSASKWKFAVDRGGTFTDVIGLDTDGMFHSLKLLSRSDDYEDASIEGVHRMLELSPADPLPADRIESIRFGTTVATNALLERKGGKVALLITKGFGDLLEIGYQDRPEIFQLCIKKTAPLYSEVVEVDERVDSNGRTIKAFDQHDLLMKVKDLKKSGVDAVAVVLMHSWTNPEHEMQCERLLSEQGFSNIFLSCKTVNLIKIVSRGQSTLVDSYLSTVLAQYLEGIKKATAGISIEFMQSSGLLTSPETFKGKNAILSGPAGGIIAVARVAEEKGIKGAIGFDMGGTSTDVCRFDGGFQKKYEQVIEGVPLQVEMMDIVTVAAGGGSILGFDGRKMSAGPESAGSYPGPACYGFGGPLTVTDANLITGRLLPDYFPRTFGADRNSSLDPEIVKNRFGVIADEINKSMNTDLSITDTAAGFLRIANEKMAMAIKEISVSRGFDVRDYALVCFGGAGGQHACSIASLLGIDRIIVHPLSSVMSAYGIGLSRPAVKEVRTLLKPYNSEMHRKLSVSFDNMEKALRSTLKSSRDNCIKKLELDLRPQGADTCLTMEYADYEVTLDAYKEQYSKLFGFELEDAELEVVNIRAEVQESEDYFGVFEEDRKPREGMPEPASFRNLYYSDGLLSAPVYLREKVPAFVKIEGPAYIIDSSFTLVIDPGFEAETDASGTISVSRVKAGGQQHEVLSDTADPVLLEVFNNIFMGIAAEMGLTLKNTAFSVNMKERLDFSCAIFDLEGGLVANAPHIPVHLGSMSDTVKAVLDSQRSSMKPGDLYLTNNPYKGGSHLPDMTVICPVYSDDGELIFFTAARGHHSDAGGSTPGSMPSIASHIDEEGVLIDGFLLVRDGVLREKALREILLDHTYPVRNISERIFDFRAQIAACHKGMSELLRTIDRYGIGTVTAYMQHIQDNSEYSVKTALAEFIKGRDSFHSRFEDSLDDGTPIAAEISISGGDNPPSTVKAVIDFTGTGGQHSSDNLNAPLSVVRSAVMYVLRTLIDNEIPLNSGCLKPVEIAVPERTVISPQYPAPVASGNVETSQRIVDVLFGAFGIIAASQGTMNNLLFAVEGEVPYYETIAGGAGAMEGCCGASGVQVHMTNTRMTDPEVLEFRHPGVRLEQFTLRRGSGGKGRFRGGDGVIREIKYLKPADVSIISERRVHAPFGIHGGGNGKKGVNQQKKADGELIELTHREVLKLGKDESIIIKTPGGGGYGQI
jgi:5-oxoprolinase (ATP-hydrolysing)